MTYSLEGGDGKLQIDPNSGEVKIISPLDYETKTFHDYRVASVSGGEIQKSEVLRLYVENEAFSPPEYNLVSTQNTNYIGNKPHIAANNSLHSNSYTSTYIPSNIGKKDSAQRTLADFNQGTLPSGTTFEITSVTGSLGCSVSCFELDSNGVLKVKSGTVFSNEVNSNHWSPEADANGIIREAEMINRLASFEANGDSKRENHTGIINIVITPPNEEPILRSIDLSPVRVEGQENVVMKFSEIGHLFLHITKINLSSIQVLKEGLTQLNHITLQSM